MSRLAYRWRVQLRLLRQNLWSFVADLAHHPLALVAGIIIIIYILAAIFAPGITPYDPIQGNLRERLHPPAWMEEGSWAHPLGTDEQGRDLLTRIIYGARISLLVGILAVSISVAVGPGAGCIGRVLPGSL